MLRTSVTSSDLATSGARTILRTMVRARQPGSRGVGKQDRLTVAGYTCPRTVPRSCTDAALGVEPHTDEARRKG
jgi:hypothetical protein